MKIGRAAGGQPSCSVVVCHLVATVTALAAFSACEFPALGDEPREPLSNGAVILTQLPVGNAVESQTSQSGGTLRLPYGDGARLLLLSQDGTTRVLTQGFHSAADPAISFDGRRLLFAGKRDAQDDWDIFEMTVQGGDIRQVTKDLGGCRSPSYQSTLYTIISPEPWYQITFVSPGAGAVNEFGNTPATHLFSCKLDGTAVRQLTYNLSSDFDPWMMDDGRLLFSAWQRCSFERGVLGQVSLFGVNIDGTDYAAFASLDEGKRIKHMPCTTPAGLAVFVETDRAPWDGAGQLGRILLRRPLHTYAPLTRDASQLFHSPSPLPDGDILVSRRSADGSDTHGVWRLDPETGETRLVFDDPGFHDIQSCEVAPRKEPDGRSSVVTESDAYSQLYCLDVYNTDLPPSRAMLPGTAKRVRILEGIPRQLDTTAPTQDTLVEAGEKNGRVWIPQLALRRILGEADVAQDGSFHLQLPANTPLQLQLIDDNGVALRSCGWIWAKNHEPRGCIGCHEDGEITPDNFLREAIALPAVSLCATASERRTVDFRRDVVPIIAASCAPCHGAGQSLPDLSSAAVVDVERPDAYAHYLYQTLLQPDESDPQASLPGKYIHSGRARTSPLVWHLLGRNVARPWDGTRQEAAVKNMPSEPAVAITDQQRQLLVEWIDLGARWAGAVEEK